MAKVCTHCNGDGDIYDADKGHKVKCPECNGSGEEE